MFTVRETIELTVHLRDGPGSLGRFMASATSCSARVLASCCYCDRSGTVVRLVTDNAEKTARALAAEGFGCARDTVVVVQTECSPRAVARIVGLLARANVPVLYSYLSWDEKDLTALVFKTADDAIAARLVRAQASGAASYIPDSPADGVKRHGVELELRPQTA
jgi:hypothetical protein